MKSDDLVTLDLTSDPEAVLQHHAHVACQISKQWDDYEHKASGF